MPRVSVILPNYNYARYLKERVRSILHQTVADFELIYLDDASTDDSNAVMEEFAGDPRVRLYPFEQNSGQVYQRWNDGAALATGDFLWFAGADDAASPCFLERMLTAFADPSVAFAYSRPLFVDGLGRLVATELWDIRNPHAVHRLQSDYVASAAAELPLLTEQCYMTTASAMLIRRDAFEAAGGFETRLRQSADWNLYMALLCAGGKVAYRQEPLSCYRVHAGTVTKNTKMQRYYLEWAYCLSRVYERLEGQADLSPIRADVRRRAKTNLFDGTADGLPVPDDLQFAVDHARRALN